MGGCFCHLEMAQFKERGKERQEREKVSRWVNMNKTTFLQFRKIKLMIKTVTNRDDTQMFSGSCGNHLPSHCR